jgi:hypothetical protein
MAGIRIEGNTSGMVAEVTGNNQIKIIPETDATNNPKNIGGVRIYAENDQGLAAGLGTVTPYLLSVETSDEYRQRVETDILLDEESFVYTLQNNTKIYMTSTTYVPSWTLTGFNTNPTNLLTAGAAALMRTYKTFTINGTETTSLDVEAAFTYGSGTTLPTNTVIEMGFGLNSTTTPYDFFDGAYLRLTPSGCYLVIRNNSGSDSAISASFYAPDGTGTTVWQPVSGRKYQFILYAMTRSVEFWISDPVTGQTWLAGDLNTPPGYGQPIVSQALPFVVRQYQASAPTIASQITVARYSIRRGGQIIATGLGESMNRIGENINSPGTLTTTANQTITSGSITRPAAAAPTNTTSLLASLSGIVLETPSLASGTDGIIMSYQNPALPTAIATTYLPTRRLRIDGIRINSFVQAAITGGPFNRNWYIAYGSTSLSLAGVATDTATTKAYRRVQLELTQAYIATQGVNTLPTQNGSNYIQFANPIYVNPGEFVALVGYNTGTVASAGTLQHNISFDYTWE